MFIKDNINLNIPRIIMITFIRTPLHKYLLLDVVDKPAW